MRTNQTTASVFFALVNLTRARISFMVLVSCAIGFILSYHGQFPFVRFLVTLLGTGLLSGGACTLNCYIERDYDALMPRTCRRPIPAGIISPVCALAFGITLVLVGWILLYAGANMLSAALGFAAVFIYVALYTPAKRLTWWNTSIGALPGAIPPLIGWASATGRIDAGGWILFAMLFIWQHTHFFPIAWLYKDDYEQAGFQMLPVLELTGKKTFALTLLTAVALLPISMLMYGSEFIGLAYCVASLVLGVLLIVAGVRLSRQPSRPNAHAVLFLSLWYLPIILAAVVVDRYGTEFGLQVHQWLEIALRWT